jgi:hypothetical protein
LNYRLVADHSIRGIEFLDQKMRLRKRCQAAYGATLHVLKELNMNTGVLTPVVTGCVNLHGMAFIPARYLNTLAIRLMGKSLPWLHKGRELRLQLPSPVFRCSFKI